MSFAHTLCTGQGGTLLLVDINIFVSSQIITCGILLVVSHSDTDRTVASSMIVKLTACACTVTLILMCMCMYCYAATHVHVHVHVHVLLRCY